MEKFRRIWSLWQMDTYTAFWSGLLVLITNLVHCLPGSFHCIKCSFCCVSKGLSIRIETSVLLNWRKIDLNRFSFFNQRLRIEKILCQRKIFFSFCIYLSVPKTFLSVSALNFFSNIYLINRVLVLVIWWSACWPSIPTIWVRIPLKSAFLLWKNCI